MIGMGMLLQSQRDIAGARTLYQQAVGTGLPDAARQAARLLAELPADT
jgi:hypothetical protein